MSLETSLIRLCYAVNRGADRGLSESMKSCIKSYSWWGAIIMALPLFGLDAIVYAIVLWSMYGRISCFSGVPFNGNAMKNILGGFIVNIVIVFILNFVLDFIVFFGWIGSAIMGYYATKLSGQAYVEVLVQLHGRNNVREHIDYQAFKEGFQGKEPIQELPCYSDVAPSQPNLTYSYTQSTPPKTTPPKYIPSLHKKSAPQEDTKNKTDITDVPNWWS